MYGVTTRSIVVAGAGPTTSHTTTSAVFSRVRKPLPELAGWDSHAEPPRRHASSRDVSAPGRSSPHGRVTADIDPGSEFLQRHLVVKRFGVVCVAVTPGSRTVVVAFGNG